ncbi:MAG: hypothetical protein CMP21_08850 [Rickettsiales bacterium]|nr:hypothetical protein [Rickettsiales bacterium]|tara:strand:+ start:190 stop:471 length:282 start_codon:yes stop_codon:yes gene_type:complete
MIQGIIVKKVLDLVLKAIFKKYNLDKMKSYVDDENELDLITKAHGKALDKYGKYIEGIEKDLAIVKANSHEPIFSKKDHKDILKRLKKLERKK